LTVEIRTCTTEELRAGVNPILQYFGSELDDEGLARFSRLLPAERMHGAFDGGEVVGAVSAYKLDMTVPGGPIPASGITLVGVRPTHRRRGVLRSLMRHQLDTIHDRGEPIAALWAAEETIYGRFGYGIASINGEIRIGREWGAFRHSWERKSTARQISNEEALEKLPPIYEQVRPGTPGMLSRSPDWWEVRRLSDAEHERQGRGPLIRVLFERDGNPVGYALYRHRVAWSEGNSDSQLDVAEAIGADLQATAEVWRYLLDVDLIAYIHAEFVPIDHPLFFILARPRRLRYRVADGLWLRLVDVEQALARRSYASDEALVLEVADDFCPWNEGRYRIERGEATRTEQEPDLRLAVRDLASVYLGGFSFGRLARAGLVEELRPDGLARADRLFASEPAPWCPEMF
jgi:predicted acetyltransferase